MKWLNHIKSPRDLKNVPEMHLTDVCHELREFLISTILKSGGHFAGNLGVVELTVALHYIFNSPEDKIIWDVGHQSYVHKILTGRQNELQNIRHFGGISGFPKISESIHDIFGTGHSSTAISAALGIAKASQIKNPDSKNKTIAVVGDGALTGGMSFEALNNLMSTGGNVLIIINDNHMGIDPNTGAMDKHLQNIENGKENIFSLLGIPYSGPFDGHNLIQIIEKLKLSKERSGPEVLHFRTVKGKGYDPAEKEQTRWHSTPKFVKINSVPVASGIKWQDAFTEILDELVKDNEKITGITPAMPSGSGMLKLMEKYPGRFFDVGIAEQHAITFAAGLAAGSLIPVVAIYSSFLQRGLDQLIHDVALQNLPVIFCVDRAGLVGEDGPTHHGAFDIALLKPIPDLQIWAPANYQEFKKFLTDAFALKKPVSIRYPKGEINQNEFQPLFDSEGILCLQKGEKIAVISTGIATQIAIPAIQKTPDVSLYHVPVIKPLAEKTLSHILSLYKTVITVEDGIIEGGFGQSLLKLKFGADSFPDFFHLGIPDQFVPHGDTSILYDYCGYGTESIQKFIEKIRLSTDGFHTSSYQ